MKVLFLLLISVGLISNLDIKSKKEELLVLHNMMRFIFQADLLTASPEIEKIAQKATDYIVEKESKNENYKIPQNTYKGENLGINIYRGNENDDLALNTLKAWGEGANSPKEYFLNPKYDPNIEHFTQIIWKSTKLLGCGITCDKKNICVVLCNYYPAGNVLDEFESNISPEMTYEAEERLNQVNAEIKEEDIQKEDDEKDKKEEEPINEEDALETFREKMIERHNYYRKEHQVEELERNSELEKIAQETAEYMLEFDQIFTTKEKYKGDFLGQSSFYIRNSKKEPVDGEKIADKWYKEVKNYDFERPNSKKQKKTINFTNMIWKNTENIGCGYACNKKECYGCCVYYPSNSYEYLYSKNVLPKTS